MKWFGKSWGAPINEDTEETSVPLGERCMHCGKVFQEGDQGLTMPRRGGAEGQEIAGHLDCIERAFGVPLDGFSP